jgi:single-strand DNA-binding protein
LNKGRQVYVEGSIRTRSWEDDAGIKRFITEINAREVQFLGGQGSGATSSGDVPPPPTPDEDIPF